MQASLKVNIITPEGEVENGTYYMVVLNAAEGELGIMQDHTPILALLQEGEVKLYSNENKIEKTIKISGGFMEVSNNECNILADSVV